MMCMSLVNGRTFTCARLRPIEPRPLPVSYVHRRTYSTPQPSCGHTYLCPMQSPQPCLSLPQHFLMLSRSSSWLPRHLAHFLSATGRHCRFRFSQLYCTAIFVFSSTSALGAFIIGPEMHISLAPVTSRSCTTPCANSVIRQINHAGRIDCCRRCEHCGWVTTGIDRSAAKAPSPLRNVIWC